MLMNNSAVMMPIESMPEMGQELLHWRRSYPDRPYFKSGLQFERYVATFKFGYDSFLLHHRERLVELLPKLEVLYREFPRGDQLKWNDAALIIGAAWLGMGGRPRLVKRFWSPDVQSFHAEQCRNLTSCRAVCAHEDSWPRLQRPQFACLFDRLGRTGVDGSGDAFAPHAQGMQRARVLAMA